AAHLSQPEPRQRHTACRAAAAFRRRDHDRACLAGDQRRIPQALPRRDATEIRAPAVTPTRIAQAVALARGWRRILIAFLAGASSALALPPTDVWPVPFVTFPILVWLIDGAKGRLGGALAAAAIGWWFGFGYLLVSLHWIGHAFLVDAKTFGWLL